MATQIPSDAQRNLVRSPGTERANPTTQSLPRATVSHQNSNAAKSRKVSRTQRAQRTKKFEISIEIEISIENEIFERATHRGPIFVGKSRRRD